MRSLPLLLTLAGLLLVVPGCASDDGPRSILNDGGGSEVVERPLEADYAVFEHLRTNVFRQEDDRAILRRLVRLADAPDPVLRRYVAGVLGRAHPLAESLGVDVDDALHTLSADPDASVQLAVVRAIAPFDTQTSRSILGGVSRRNLPSRVGDAYLGVVDEARDAIADRVPDKDVDRFRTSTLDAARGWVRRAPSGTGDRFQVIELESGRLHEMRLNGIDLRVSVPDINVEAGAYYSEAIIAVSIVERRDGVRDRGPSRYRATSPYGWVTSSGEYGWLELYARHLGEDRVRLWVRRRALGAGAITE